ncbi:MAG: rhodanese-like domain-containing protein [Propylenella sp.]
MQALLEEAMRLVPRISPEDAKAMLDRGEAVALDVREAAEVERTGKVPGAIAIPRGMIEALGADLPAHEPKLDKEKAVIAYCGSGARSALAGKVLKELGYERVYNLGGLKDWVGAGHPVER